MQRFISMSVIAKELGVTQAVVSTWFLRELPGMPEHVAEAVNARTVQKLWNENQLSDWLRWYQGWKLKSAEYRLAKAQAQLAQAEERIRQLKDS
jgi:hypothetical protein